MIAQRAVAAILTLLLVGLVVVGLWRLFAVFGHPGWGLVVGAATVVVMAGSFIVQGRHER